MMVKSVHPGAIPAVGNFLTVVLVQAVLEALNPKEVPMAATRKAKVTWSLRKVMVNSLLVFGAITVLGAALLPDALTASNS
jgi:hypothetical protein